MYVLCCAKLLQSYLLFAILWNLAYQTPLSLGLSRQEYWSWLPFPLPGDLPNPWIKPTSPVSPALVGRFFTTETLGKPYIYIINHNITGATTSKVAMNMYIQVFMCTFSFLQGKCPEVQLLSDVVRECLVL